MPEFKNPQDRIKYLDQLIAGKTNYTRQELREKLNDWMESEEYGEISTRQFAKDIDRMKDLAGEDGIELVYSRREGRYRYMKYNNHGELVHDPEYSISGIPLNQQDFEILTQALAVLNSIHGLKNTRALEEIIEKLAEKLKIKVDQLEGVIEFDTVPELKGIDHLNTLLNKIIEKQVIVMHYKPYQGDEISYLFHPYFLKEYNNRWYVFGWNEEEDKIYNVPLDRIESYEDSFHKFNNKKRIKPEEYFKDIVGVTKLDEPIQKLQYKFKMPRALYVETKPIHHSQKKLKETEEFIIFQIEVIPNKELESVIASFGEDVEVLR